MAELAVSDGNVEVKLTFAEKAGGVHGDFSFPIASILSVTANADPITAIRGLKAPGAGFPNRKIGTWRTDRTKDYVNVSRGEPGLIISLTGQDFDRIIVSLPNPTQSLSQLVAAGANPATTEGNTLETTQQ